MSKSYVKDTNGKYKLVDKQEPQTQQLTLEALDARLKRVEAMFNGGLAEHGTVT